MLKLTALLLVALIHFGSPTSGEFGASIEANRYEQEQMGHNLDSSSRIFGLLGGYKFHVKCGDQGTKPSWFETRIINGRPASEGQFPSFVSLAYWSNTEGYLHNCGGVLIDDDLVLTAAHCISLNLPIYVAQTNSNAMNWNMSYSLNIHRAARTCSGSRYGRIREKLVNDYGLIRLSSPIENARTACLPRKALAPGQIGIQVGNGYISNELESASSLQYFEAVEIISTSPEQDPSRISLIGIQNETMVMPGDSGSPLYADQDGRSTVFGLVSTGSKPYTSANVYNLRHEILKLAAECQLK